MSTVIHPGNIPISAYSYYLPDDRIAQFPLDERDKSKLLVYRDGTISEDIFLNLPENLPENSTIIFNETKVVHARLLFRKSGGSQVEVFCLEPAGPFRDLQMAFQERGSSEWLCLIGNSRRWGTGALRMETGMGDSLLSFSAERMERLGPVSRIRFKWHPEGLTFSDILEAFGKVPLPPYISRPATDRDKDQYQTVYAVRDGSVAAPTAGLHFTGNMLKTMDDKGFRRINFTLHVGAGTFRPVISDLIGQHEMHPEQILFDLENLKRLYQSLDSPLVLVGTTSVRMMESLYWHGVKLITGQQIGKELDIGQWDPYDIGDDHGISRKDSLEKVIEELEKNSEPGVSGKTRLMIAPGYRFKYPNVLITNFHQPNSTLLLLIAAFIGPDWKKAYQYALDQNFRFLSYGDSCLFYPVI